MNADLPRLGRMPAEGPTYRQRHDAALKAAYQRANAGAAPDAKVVCVRPGHGTDPMVAELWSVGNEVLWLARFPNPSGADFLHRVLLPRLEALGIDWRSRRDFEHLKSHSLSVHLLNVPPEERVDCTEVEGLSIDDEPQTVWHTSEWPDGADVVAYCPVHGKMAPPERAELLALLASGQRRFLLE